MIRRFVNAPVSLLCVAMGVFVLQGIFWHCLRSTLYTPIPREHRLGLAEYNPLWGFEPAPPRGETEIDHQIRNHVAHQLINFADHYAPQRPLEHIRKMVYPTTGRQPELTWLHWASSIAPHDLKTVRTENFWIFTLLGPDAAAKAVHRAIMDDPQNSLLLLDLAYAQHYNPEHHYPPGQYSLQVFKHHQHWNDWDMSDTTQLAQILFSELRSQKKNPGPRQQQLAQALGATLTHLQDLRAEDHMPAVSYDRALEMIAFSSAPQ